MIRRPPRSTLSSSSAASDVYKRQDFYKGKCERMPDCVATPQRWERVEDWKPWLLARESHGADEIPQLPVLPTHEADWVQGMPVFLDALIQVDGDDLADEQVVAAEVQGLAHDALDVDGALRHQWHGCGRSLFAGKCAQLPLVSIYAGHHAAEVEFPGMCNIRHVDDEGASLDDEVMQPAFRTDTDTDHRGFRAQCADPGEGRDVRRFHRARSHENCRRDAQCCRWCFDKFSHGIS